MPCCAVLRSQGNTDAAGFNSPAQRVSPARPEALYCLCRLGEITPSRACFSQFLSCAESGIPEPDPACRDYKAAVRRELDSSKLATASLPDSRPRRCLLRSNALQ